MPELSITKHQIQNTLSENIRNHPNLRQLVNRVFEGLFADHDKLDMDQHWYYASQEEGIREFANRAIKQIARVRSLLNTSDLSLNLPCTVDDRLDVKPATYQEALESLEAIEQLIQSKVDQACRENSIPYRMAESFTSNTEAELGLA